MGTDAPRSWPSFRRYTRTLFLPHVTSWGCGPTALEMLLLKGTHLTAWML